MFARHRRPRTSAPADQQAQLLVAEARARIEVDDAAAARELTLRERELEIAAKARRLADEEKERATARARARDTARKLERATKRAARKKAREKWWAARKTRFGELLSGRMVALLVGMAMSTAWYGQYRYLHDPTTPTGPADPTGLGLIVLFAGAGATALEVFGIAMFAIVRQASGHRDRAVRARILGWSVIAFSAWSNWTHNGPALAALSVIGPLGWEIHEWWRHRAVLHKAGLLAHRPVRPRFPIDQVVLFPLWTLHAYRVAVRDRIESADKALALAKQERVQRRAFGWRARRRFTRQVRAALAGHMPVMKTPPDQPAPPKKSGPAPVEAETERFEPVQPPADERPTQEIPAVADQPDDHPNEQADGAPAPVKRKRVRRRTEQPPADQPLNKGEKTQVVKDVIDELLAKGTTWDRLTAVEVERLARERGVDAHSSLYRRVVARRREEAMGVLVEQWLTQGRALADLHPTELVDQMGGDEDMAARAIENRATAKAAATNGRR